MVAHARPPRACRRPGRTGLFAGLRLRAGAEFATLEFAHPLWILFSSGMTGLPKGIVQSHGGILLEHLKSLGLCMDIKPNRPLPVLQLHELDGVELPGRWSPPRASPRHVPDEVIRVPVIPRTLTRKKLEIPVKRILQGMPSDQAAATSSVDHPEALALFARLAAGRGHGSARVRS